VGATGAVVLVASLEQARPLALQLQCQPTGLCRPRARSPPPTPSPWPRLGPRQVCVDALAALKQQQAEAAAGHAARLSAAEAAAARLEGEVRRLAAARAAGPPYLSLNGNGANGHANGANGAARATGGAPPADPWKAPRHEDGGA
jgi:hypothetical protein